MKEYSELKPLFLVLKHALLGIRFESDEKYRVMDTTRGGIASFVVVCLIVHYLKVGKCPFPCKITDGLHTIVQRGVKEKHRSSNATRQSTGRVFRVLLHV